MPSHSALPEMSQVLTSDDNIAVKFRVKSRFSVETDIDEHIFDHYGSQKSKV